MGWIRLLQPDGLGWGAEQAHRGGSPHPPSGRPPPLPTPAISLPVPLIGGCVSCPLQDRAGPGGRTFPPSPPRPPAAHRSGHPLPKPPPRPPAHQLHLGPQAFQNPVCSFRLLLQGDGKEEELNRHSHTRARTEQTDYQHGPRGTAGSCPARHADPQPGGRREPSSPASGPHAGSGHPGA